MVVEGMVDIAFCNYEAVRVVTMESELKHAFLIYRSDRVIGEAGEANNNPSSQGAGSVAPSSHFITKNVAYTNVNSNNCSQAIVGGLGDPNKNIPIGPVNTVLVFILDSQAELLQW
jgi:hypothetical protein